MSKKREFNFSNAKELYENISVGSTIHIELVYEDNTIGSVIYSWFDFRKLYNSIGSKEIDKYLDTEVRSVGNFYVEMGRYTKEQLINSKVNYKLVLPKPASEFGYIESNKKILESMREKRYRNRKKNS